MTAPDTVKAPSVCLYSECKREPSANSLCRLHDFRRAVITAYSMVDPGRPDSGYVSAEPYGEFLSKVAASRTLTLGRHRIQDLTLREVAEVMGIDYVTFWSIARGQRQRIQARVALAVDPFKALCGTTPLWTVKVGQQLTAGVMAKYAPMGTTVVDSQRRAWQLRGASRHTVEDRSTPTWSPAHPVGVTPVGTVEKGHPAWPATVVWLPPFVTSMHP